jgi:hypothetical protein
MMNYLIFYEDCEIGWVDDFPLVNTMVLNWLINLQLLVQLKFQKKSLKTGLIKSSEKNCLKLLLKMIRIYKIL